MTARHIYVDETKKRSYLLVASVHVAADVARLRGTVQGLLLPGQRYLHMKNEAPGRKRTIADALVRSGVQATIYRAGPQHRNERARRAACLRSLVEDNAAVCGWLVLDQDDGMLSWDNQRLIEFTRGGWLS